MRNSLLLAIAAVATADTFVFSPPPAPPSSGLDGSEQSDGASSEETFIALSDASIDGDGTDSDSDTIHADTVEDRVLVDPYNSGGYGTDDPTRDAFGACSGFYDLDFDPWRFAKYREYFNDESTFELYPAGKFTGPAAIKEYVKFASDESPFVDSFTVLPGSLALLKSLMGADNSCIFIVMGHRRYELSARYARGEAVHVATMATVVYVPSTHKIRSIMLYYETPFMQFVFDSLRSKRASKAFVCDLLMYDCPARGVDTATPNAFASHDECIERFDELKPFDAGPELAASWPLGNGGGFDGDSQSCRLLHSFLASINPDHCAHLSFVPMADPFGKIKCSSSSSKMMTPHEHFELADFENFDQYKEAVGYPLDDGFMVVDRCIYDSLRASIPRPYWSAWRDAQTATAEEVLDWWRAPPLEHIPHDSWQYMTTYIVWVSVLILGLGSEYVVGTVITAYLSMENLAIFWKAAAFTFPLFVTIALVSHAFWGLLFLVLGLWKCGSPETLVFLLMARNKSYSCVFRAQCAMNFLGTLLHHSATSLLVVSLTTHSEFLDRNVLSCTLPLVVQHWFVLSRYIDVRLYVVLELLIEVVWEWEVLFNVTAFHCHSWNILLIAYTMLVAHWLYLSAATLKYVGQAFTALCGKKNPPVAPAAGDDAAAGSTRWTNVRQSTLSVKARGNNSNLLYAALHAAEEVRDPQKTRAPKPKAVGLLASLQLKPADDNQLAHHWQANMKHKGSKDYGGAAPNPPGGGTAGGMSSSRPAD